MAGTSGSVMCVGKILIVVGTQNNFLNIYTIYFRTIIDFLKVFNLLLIWWTIKSKTWLREVGTLCANAHF